MPEHQLFPAKAPARFNLVIVHGMQEYGGRYRAFAEYLSEQGGNVITFDLPGHGAYKNLDTLGDFGEEGLSFAFTEISTLFQSFANDLPNVLFGHSMGSAIALRYAEQHQNLALLILSGLPVKPVWMLNAGYRTAKVEQQIRPNKPSVLSNVFKGYNKAFKPNHTTSDWLSANPDNVQHYIDDPLCGYDICPHYYVEMFGMMRYAFRASELAKLDPKLKVFVIWGEKDPVTGFGRGARHFAKHLSQQGLDVQTHEYAGMRHEILNEVDHMQVYADIAQFINEQI
jgi:alpha-beta hydrolase superfamily lysophospholipase